MKYIKLFEAIKYNYNRRKTRTQLFRPVPEDTEEMFCRYNDLIELPELPKNLKKLNCRGNQLQKLPKLPDTLEYLHCRDNKLTELPKLPDTLEFLDCSNNELTELPEIPSTLTFLDCSGNKLKRLPENLPKGLQIVGYDNNWEDPREIVNYCNNDQLLYYNSYEFQKDYFKDDSKLLEKLETYILYQDLYFDIDILLDRNFQTMVLIRFPNLYTIFENYLLPEFDYLKNELF